tara:strand:+ start:965 stop:1747 length:783 start_codon:yes stop_codon:yes gene_type:complete
MPSPEIEETLSALTAHLSKSLEHLRGQIESAVREEQLRNRLTGLPNNEALTGLLEGALGKAGPYWVAFVEVDKFKDVNAKFGHDNANAVLVAIARQLESSATYFPERITPFHAHGDEFFLFGEMETTAAEVVAQKLEVVRAGVEAISLASSKGPMSCTVSIGWRTWQDGEVAGVRGLHDDLELANNVAKSSGRNCVVRYGPELHEARTIDQRADCSTCQTRFSYLVLVKEFRDGEPIHCPNCGSTTGRPPRPEDPEPEDI